MIVWVASYPRSGNSLVMSLLWRLFGLRTSSIFAEECDKDEGNLGRIYGYERLSYEKFARWMLDDKSRFIKTHNACTDSLPALYIVRDGRDVLVSAAHFNVAMKYTHLDFEAELRRLVLDNRYSWSRRVLWWIQKRAAFGPTAVVKFEDLLTAPAGGLCNAMDKLHIPDINFVVCGMPATFDELHALEPRQFRKGQAGIWRTEMSQEIQELFWQRHGGAMRELGYAL